jgi:hypothetical protein
MNRFEKNVVSQKKNTLRGRSLLVIAFALACIFGAVGKAAAQRINSPATPTDITPPRGNTAFLLGRAKGTQGYTCLPTSTGGTAWNPTARPEATLFADFFGHPIQIITHFTSLDENPHEDTPKPVPLSGNATWQSSFDTSKVWAGAIGHIDAGTDASCPNKGSIQCLLLQSLGNEVGPTGGKLLDKVSFVQRLNTKGGAVPVTACTAGQTQLVPYTADYYFFHEE